MLKNKISFILNNKIKQIDFDEYNPETTVLDYLRSLPNRKGTKEGCAEGDCGACTIVIAELDVDDTLIYKAYNSCLIFLPFLHGKQLITIEDLGSFNKLHPIQLSFVENDGSQCGYCTPGFIMSVFALSKKKENASINEIKNSLAGNLCRCTGYESIIKSSKISLENIYLDLFDKNEEETKKKISKINNNSNIELIHKKQKYYIPYSISECLNLKERYPNSTITNGATDVCLNTKKTKSDSNTLIDISNIAELKQYSISNKAIIIGAGLDLESIRLSFKNQLPALSNILSVFGSLQIRNKATLGGNIASASPIGDTLPLLIAYNANMILLSKNGDRKVALYDFIIGYRKTLIEQNEIIKAIEIPIEKKHTIIKSYKVSKRKYLDISTISAAFSLKLNKNTIENISIVYGGMAEMVKRAKDTEIYLKGKKFNNENINVAKDILLNEFKPISDARANANTRNIMAANLLIKFGHEIMGS